MSWIFDSAFYYLFMILIILFIYSSKDEGYDTYDWPAEGFYPGDIPVCDVIPPDGRGVPEQVCVCIQTIIVSLLHCK